MARSKGKKRTMRFMPVAVIWLLFMAGLPGNAQEVLDDYIRTALENNLRLQQSEHELQKRYLEVKKARSYFFPSIEFQARYSVARGGRTIDFPVGDLLNPVYKNLNQINQDLYGHLPPEVQPPEYPGVDNQSFNFYRPSEHETKLQLNQVIFSPEVYYSSQISKERLAAEKFSKQLMEREIIENVKTAYFSYLKTVQLANLLDNTREVLEENLRVNKKLHAEDKVTRDHVHSSRAELQKLQQQKAVAEKNRQSAQAWFNYLLNRPLDTNIVQDSIVLALPQPVNLQALQDTAQHSRLEPRILQARQRAAGENVKRKRSQTIPELVGVVNYGFQGEKYRFTEEQDFAIASLVLRWPLFTGLRNKQEIQKAKVQQAIAENQYRQTQQKIRLDIIRAYYDYQAAEQAYEEAVMQEQSRKSAFMIIEKKFENGQSSLLEYMHARNEKTSAEVNTIISKYDILIKLAELEKAVAAKIR
ncbi:MAG: TolC family protein [Bacteroidales bacterium]